MVDCIRHKFVVIDKSQLTHNIICMTLESEDKIPDMPISSFVYIYNDQNEYRPYIPFCKREKELEFAIKIYPDGNLSKYITSKNIGDILYVSDFIKRRKNIYNEFKNVVGIAGGTGIVPIYQILNENLHYESNKTFYRIFLLNKSEDDIFLKKELTELQETFKNNLEIIHVIEDGCAIQDKNHLNGMLDKEMFVEQTKDKKIDFIYICGPLSLLEVFTGDKTDNKKQYELKGVLEELGYTEKNVYKF